MKTFLTSLLAIAQSKAFKLGIIGAVGSVLMHKLGLPEEVAAESATGIFWITIALIAKQAGVDIATKGASSHSTPTE